jgi:CrcB protein
MTLVAVGGGAGSVARYGLAVGAKRAVESGLPLGTLAANLLGCAAAGVVGFFLFERQTMTEGARLLLLSGFLGGLTTFSAFGLETVAAFRQGDARTAILNITLNVAGSLVAVWVGWMVARAAVGAPAPKL